MGQSGEIDMSGGVMSTTVFSFLICGGKISKALLLNTFQ